MVRPSSWKSGSPFGKDFYGTEGLQDLYHVPIKVVSGAKPRCGREEPLPVNPIRSQTQSG